MQWVSPQKTTVILELFSLLEVGIGNGTFTGGVNAGPKDGQISDLVSLQSTFSLTPFGWRNGLLHELFTGEMSNVTWGLLSSETAKLKKSWGSLAVTKE